LFVQLEELIISNLSSKIIKPTNVISIFVKSHKILPKIEEICLKFITNNFLRVVQTNEFEELDLDLMRILVKHVVPKLPKIEANKIDNESDEDDNDDDDETNSEDVDDGFDLSLWN
jgi:hypothetical protein